MSRTFPCAVATLWLQIGVTVQRPDGEPGVQVRPVCEHSFMELGSGAVVIRQWSPIAGGASTEEQVRSGHFGDYPGEIFRPSPRCRQRLVAIRAEYLGDRGRHELRVVGVIDR